MSLSLRGIVSGLGGVFGALGGRLPTLPARPIGPTGPTFTPPAAPLPSGAGAMPGVSTAGVGALPGLGGLIGRLGGAVGRTVGRAARGPIGGAVAGAAAGYALDNLFGNGRPRHRRMNVLNDKALRRANRRMQGFRTTATKTLGELGYTVKRKGSGGSSCGCGPRKKKC